MFLSNVTVLIPQFFIYTYNLYITNIDLSKQEPGRSQHVKRLEES